MILAKPWHVIHVPQCASTNDHLKEQWLEYQPLLPILVWADEQTAGRGRDLRSWHSPAGLGLYVSFMLEFSHAEHLPYLALASAIAVCNALEAHHAESLAVKWPNDVVFQKRKIAGILIENIFQGDHHPSIIGIGINLNHTASDFPATLRPYATSLFTLTGCRSDVSAVLQSVAQQMLDQCLGLEKGCIDPLLTACRLRCEWLVGKEIQFHHHQQLLTGTFMGIADSGGAIIRSSSGTKTLFSGEINIV